MATDINEHLRIPVTTPEVNVLWSSLAFKRAVEQCDFITIYAGSVHNDTSVQSPSYRNKFVVFGFPGDYL